jgi:hypothetical protein
MGGVLKNGRTKTFFVVVVGGRQCDPEAAVVTLLWCGALESNMQFVHTINYI